MGRSKSNLSRKTKHSIQQRLKIARETDEERSERLAKERERKKLAYNRKKEMQKLSSAMSSTDQIRITKVMTLIPETDSLTSETEWLDRVRLRTKMHSEKAWLDSIKERLNCKPRLESVKGSQNTAVANTLNSKLYPKPDVLWNSEKDPLNSEEEMSCSENNQLTVLLCKFEPNPEKGSDNDPLNS